MSNVWAVDGVDPRDHGGSKPVGEKATVLEYLAHFRTTLELKCGGLAPEQLAARSVPPSTLSLLGLVRHLAFVEHFWFQKVAQGSSEPRLYEKDRDRDADFNGAEPTAACVEEAFTAWRREIERADQWLETVREADLGRELTIPGHGHGGETVSVRDLLVHLVEEYARHCGHADLLRECIDGRTGQ